MSLSPVSSRDSDFQPAISQNLYGPRSLSQGGPYPPEEEKQLRRMFRKHGIAAVLHGFRSSFRDWAAEETDHPREVIEAALAHVVQNRVEAAYRRTDLFERRRRLMNDWATYLAGETLEPEAAGSR